MLTEYPEVLEASEKLQSLTSVLAEPKEVDLERRARTIQEHIGLAEAYQALRQHRWSSGVYCTHCGSHRVQSLPAETDNASAPQAIPASTHSTPEPSTVHRFQAQLAALQHPTEPAVTQALNHRYYCLDCQTTFQDDDAITGAGGAHGTSVQIWMQCWYLMGCTDSLSHIAQLLGLDLANVEWISERLKTLFSMHAPRTSNAAQVERAASVARAQKFESDLLAAQEHLDANIAGVPFDTTEYRRQQRIRRTLSGDTNSSASPQSTSSAPVALNKNKRNF